MCLILTRACIIQLQKKKILPLNLPEQLVKFRHSGTCVDDEGRGNMIGLNVDFSGNLFLGQHLRRITLANRIKLSISRLSLASRALSYKVLIPLASTNAFLPAPLWKLRQNVKFNQKNKTPTQIGLGENVNNLNLNRI